MKTNGPNSVPRPEHVGEETVDDAAIGGSSGDDEPVVTDDAEDIEDEPLADL